MAYLPLIFLEPRRGSLEWVENSLVKRSRFGGFSRLIDLEFGFRLSKWKRMRGRNLRGSNRPLNAKSEIWKVRSFVTAAFCDIYFDYP
jgi:hypothetical protein